MNVRLTIKRPEHEYFEVWRAGKYLWCCHLDTVKSLFGASATEIKLLGDKVLTIEVRDDA